MTKTTGEASPEGRMGSVDLKTAVCMPEHFVFDTVPERPNVVPTLVALSAPELGPLKAFRGTFAGHGFNSIVRPQNPATPSALPAPQPNSNNVLSMGMSADFEIAVEEGATCVRVARSVNTGVRSRGSLGERFS